MLAFFHEAEQNVREMLGGIAFVQLWDGLSEDCPKTQGRWSRGSDSGQLAELLQEDAPPKEETCHHLARYRALHKKSSRDFGCSCKSLWVCLSQTAKLQFYLQLPVCVVTIQQFCARTGEKQIHESFLRVGIWESNFKSYKKSDTSQIHGSVTVADCPEDPQEDRSSVQKKQ